MEIADEHVRRTFLPDIPTPECTQVAFGDYCTISTDRSHLVMRDAHSSLTLMFTTGGDA
jgi:hypothetical protein